MTSNCYIHPFNQRAAEFLMKRGYTLTPGTKDFFGLWETYWGCKCVLFVNFPGSGTAFHKLLVENNLLYDGPLKPFATYDLDD